MGATWDKLLEETKRRYGYGQFDPDEARRDVDCSPENIAFDFLCARIDELEERLSKVEAEARSPTLRKKLPRAVGGQR